MINPYDAIKQVKELQNPTGTPRDNYGYRSVNWNVKTATEHYSLWDQRLADIVKEYSSSVLAELEAFDKARAASPTEHAIRCFVFAILSPQSNFAENVYATQNIMRDYDKLATVTDVYECLEVPFHGDGSPRLLNLGAGKSRYLFAALPWLDRLTDDNIDEMFSYERIIEHKGMGEKTTAMALALFNQHSKVFTLDTWMLRLTIALTGGDSRAIIRTTTAGYKLTEGAWLAFSEMYLPQYSPFLVQWTLWNLCFGKHASHLGILA